MESFVKEYDNALIRITPQENGCYQVEFEDRNVRIIDVALDGDQCPVWFFLDRKDDDKAKDIGLLIEEYME